jgi:uncharacterized protein (TIGR04168 family)
MVGRPLPSGIAVIGDLHSAWDDADVAYFNRSAYQLLLFTGDLGASTREDGSRIATSISRIERDVLVMPGNNDAAQHGALAAELAYRQGAKSLLRGLGGGARAPEVKLCGYSSHSFALPAGELTVIAGRPFSMGGPELTFKAELAAHFGISSVEQSAARIAELAAAAPTRDVIVLSHNGPCGLGASAHSIWGRDFAEPSADWGDVDLAKAIELIHARGGRRVLAVIAGHMHSPIRGGGERELEQRRNDVLYLNPARVPRIFEREDGHEVRHHVELTVLDGALHAQHHLVALDDA